MKQTDNRLAFDPPHRKELVREIAELQSRLQPHDTGHIRTAINVLELRVQEIDRFRKKEKDWKDPLLLGKY